MNASFATIAVALLIAGPQDAQEAPLPAAAASNDRVAVNNCVVALIDDVQIPALEAGVLADLKIKPGRNVAKGRVLAVLDTRDVLIARNIARVELSIANRQAESAVEVKAAKKQFEVAEKEFNSSLEINAKAPGTIAQNQVEREELTMVRADYQHQAAEVQREINFKTAELRSEELRGAERRLQKHYILAPHDGVVVQIFRRPGEWVQPGEQVLRLVRMNKLRIEGFVNALNNPSHTVLGRKVTISVRHRRALAGEGPEGGIMTLDARVDYVSPLIEGNGDYRVWAEIDNVPARAGWMLQAGMDATMSIDLTSPPIDVSANDEPPATIPATSDAPVAKPADEGPAKTDEPAAKPDAARENNN